MTKLINVLRFTTRIIFLLGLSLIVLWLVLARPFVFSSDCSSAKLSADPATLERHTRKISTEFSPRSWKHVDNLDRAANYIADEFRLTNSNVSFQEFQVRGSTYRNVISEYGSSQNNSAIVVGAHYDAFGDLPAADDNASGVAGLLELGRLLSSQNLSIKVILVAYSLEEPPFFRSENMGSAIHAASLVKAGTDLRMMISLEMIGYYSDLPESQNYPSPLLNLLYPSRGNFIAIVGPLSFSSATIRLKKAFLNSVPLPVKSINAPALVPGIDYSDHLNYWKQGFDVLMLTDTAFLRNLEYHKKGDTADRLDYVKMAQVITGLNSFLVAY